MAEKAVTVVIGQISYKGPDVHCYASHYEFFHYLGKLQERSAWANNVPDELDPATNGRAELQPGDPEFRFFSAVHTGNSLIGQARDAVVEKALEYEADYLFFFDDDMIFARDTFLRLWRRQKDIIGALAFTARHPIAPVIWKFKKTWDFDKRAESVDSVPMLDYPKDQLVQVDCIGTGVVLINMDVFRRLKKPWFHGAVGAGEDFHFCWNAGKAGFQIYCDTSVKTLHKPNAPPWHDEQMYLNSPESALRHREEILNAVK